MPKEATKLLLAHWNELIEEASVTPMEFFDLVLQALTDRNIPHKSVSYITRREGGTLSACRTYLRIRWRRVIFDIGAMRFGDGALCVSAWLSQTPPGLFDLFCEIPLLRSLLRRYIRPVTFYRVDTISAFQRMVHDSVLEVVAQIASGKVLRGTQKETHPPLMKEFYER